MMRYSKLSEWEHARLRALDNPYKAPVADPSTFATHIYCGACGHLRAIEPSADVSDGEYVGRCVRVHCHGNTYGTREA